jgi:cytochrome c-type biogenesis protein CcmH/NrfG
VPILFVGVVVLMIVLAVVNARRLRSKGISPLATDAEIMADAVRSSSARQAGEQTAEGAARTLEARLDEIERLQATGKITAAERDSARATLLRSL